MKPELNELERDRTIARLEPKSMKVLVFLASRPGTVLAKDRIIRSVWGESYVTEEVLTHAIWELRKALGDDARDPRFIQTIPKRGYRLLAPVNTESGSTRDLEVVSHYTVGKKLGGGAMGVVHRAEDSRLKRTVAIKFLPRELGRGTAAKQRFLGEARAAAVLDDPNLCPVYEVGETDQGQLFIVMPFYEGGTLKKKIARGPLAVSEALELAIQVARGLEKAHQAGIVHRDIKPANVMVTRDGTAKIVDFGLAKLSSAQGLSRDGMLVGTPAYMSPEQALGRPVDHRTDLWSLGVLLYEMLAGAPPFSGDSSTALIQAIVHDEPPSLETRGSAGIARGIQGVLRRALAKDPEKRYADAASMLDDLERLGEELGDNGTTQMIPVPYRAPARRRKRILGAALLLVLLGATAWVYLGRDGLPLQQGIEADPSELDRLLTQASFYEQRGDLRDTLATAESLYRRALKLARDDPSTQARLSLLLARIQRQYPAPGRGDEVRALAERALEADPEQAPAWVALGILSLLGGDAEAAELAGRRAQTADADDFGGHVLVGEALIDQGEVEAGLAELQRGVEVGAGHIWARLVLGLRFRQLSRYEEAAREFRKVLEYAPDSPNALNNLGLVLNDMGRSADALPYFRKVMDLYPDDRAATNLGNAFFKQNRLEEAIAAYHQAHELAPQRPTHARNLGDGYEALGDLESARGWFETALELYDAALTAGGPQGTLIGLRAVCAAKLGRHDEAIENLERALELSPRNAYLLFVGSQVHALAGDDAGMYRFAEQALEAGISRDEFRTDPSFERYRDEPRFRSLLEG